MTTTPTLRDAAQALPSFDDPRVKAVYRLLCSDETPPNREEHWEGWVARRIVAALAAPADALAEPVGVEPFGWYSSEHGDVDDIEWNSQRPTYEGDWRPLYCGVRLQQAVKRARKEEQEIMHGLLRPVVVEAIRGMRGAPDIEENGKSLVTEIEDVFRAAIRAKGQQ